MNSLAISDSIRVLRDLFFRLREPVENSYLFFRGSGEILSRFPRPGNRRNYRDRLRNDRFDI